ncbi:hypothetical protein GNE08_27355 (plasmid) [Trichormus variabilis ARAD]|uniref:Transposase n=1 Tax=Trichormus variabilis N2B TaxID=2681315 RepID=A0ABR6SGN2_ANAVA|nr:MULTISPECIES: hypothetical protein [Nostocaceae]MBC1217913.1 hypothetical protein [Trichormus variabilis ARAD]MBC1259109.1 hypothetical protein [Trichormus variabilis V5]MBC1270660.1 hypothetical protein [Trichormus variabilis FSR]MBC1305540.1 hypothetical protein [Trichormus variabilis N2B]MBC1314562.1 hypothetical protein [Trichormus variabilis PNB]
MSVLRGKAITYAWVSSKNEGAMKGRSRAASHLSLICDGLRPTIGDRLGFL